MRQPDNADRYPMLMEQASDRQAITTIVAHTNDNHIADRARVAEAMRTMMMDDPFCEPHRCPFHQINGSNRLPINGSCISGSQFGGRQNRFHGHKVEPHSPMPCKVVGYLTLQRPSTSY